MRGRDNRVWKNRVCPHFSHVSRCSRGFTLVELLVALTLLGLISVLLFGGLRFGARAWDAGESRLAALGEVEAVQTLLRRQLAQITVPRQVRTEDGRSPMFAGSAGSLRYVAPLPARTGLGGLYVFDLDTGGAGEGLSLAWRVHRPDVPLAERNQELAGERLLLPGAAAVRFSYYGRHRPEEPLAWRDDWDAASTMPLLIRVEVSFPAGDGRRWPELIVAPMFGRGPVIAAEALEVAP
jgi:general secretion pathway protein J